MKVREIEAHQVALLAVATALDLDWEGEVPTVKPTDRWPSFSSLVEDPGSRSRILEKANGEQVYLQAFVFERALESVQTKNAGIAAAVFEAWDYYLRELPHKHGRTDFFYNAWRQRRELYRKVWNTTRNPEAVQNPFFYLSVYFFEDVCGLEDWLLPVTKLTSILGSRAINYSKVAQEWWVTSV